MRHAALATTSLIVAIYSGFGSIPAHASDLLWEVESPFRFFKRTASFDMHERAFNAARGAATAPLPANVLWRTERRLNDPDCKDSSNPNSCAETARARYEVSRQGWASQTVDFTCYDRNARPRRYSVTCDRQYSWGVAKEDYILPDAHTVHVRLAPERLAEVPTGDCTWTWTPHRAGARGETRKQPCKDKFVIKRLPYSTDRAASGATVKVVLPDGRELVEAGVSVEDVFLVAFGDSFASGEGNPDKPVVFSAAREMVYDPTNSDTRDVASRSMPKFNYGVASAPPGVDPKALPKRRMEDEERSLIYRPNTPEFQAAFDKRGAQWLSADCHRSQYGYPFRVGIGLALENRHRSITFVSLACSGSDVLEGLFAERDAREKIHEPGGSKVVSQFDQLSDLICRGGAQGRTASGSYVLPVYDHGSTSIGSQTIGKRWCPPANRKRSIDLVLLSIGGNDVGFSALAMYAMTENARDLAPIAGWIGHQIRYSPDVARKYMAVLDQRFKAVKAALADGFGVDPSRVVQNAYEQIQFDETGGPCGAQPTLGVDVHPNFSYSKARVSEVSNFARELQARLECIADVRKGQNCPAGLATGQGTGFRFVTDHMAEFNKRGLCARDPKKAFVDQVNMAMPRMSRATQGFEPYNPAYALPYAHHWRLVRNPNDAFLIANTHREGISLFDLLQPAYAALYSGAFHPTAEGHAIVADHVIKHARDVLAKNESHKQAAR